MAELVERVAKAIWGTGELPMDAEEAEVLARAAIAEVFDALKLPSAEAKRAGEIDIAATCDQCPHYEYTLDSFYGEKVWQAMLEQARRDAGV